jgi:hypothetical protein
MTSFDKLHSWTESANEGIRFFSGIATYRKDFELPESLAKRNRRVIVTERNKTMNK